MQWEGIAPHQFILIKTNMKIFNSIQIVTTLVTSPIWLNALQNATFTGHTVALWVGAAVTCIFFCWAIAGVAETMGE